VKPTDRRFTPLWLVDLVRDALGPIALDPCTEPNNPTRAERFFTAADDGLVHDWREASGGGVIWVNPPFSEMLRWSDKVQSEAHAGCEIVMLTAIDSTTRWFSRLNMRADIAAPLKRRLKFGFPAEDIQPKSAANAACMLWYFGKRDVEFLRVFRDHSHPYVPGAFCKAIQS